MDVYANKELQAQLVDVFVSQVKGGNNYTDAILAKHVSNAPFFTSHITDKVTGLSIWMDMPPLLLELSFNPVGLVKTFLTDFQVSVVGMIEAMR